MPNRRLEPTWLSGAVARLAEPAVGVVNGRASQGRQAAQPRTAMRLSGPADRLRVAPSQARPIPLHRPGQSRRRPKRAARLTRRWLAVVLLRPRRERRVVLGGPRLRAGLPIRQARRAQAGRAAGGCSLGFDCDAKFQLGADVPPWPWDASARKKWPISESQRDAYWKLRLRLHPSRRYRLGYPFNTTLAYDPTPGPGWRSLLTLSSDDKLEWCWHDGDWLVTFIEEQ
jgi:hypothetical protein